MTKIKEKILVNALAILTLTISVNSFQVHSLFPSASPIQKINSPTIGTISNVVSSHAGKLSSSSGDDFNIDDLAKLRKKRQEILARKSAAPPGTTPEVDVSVPILNKNSDVEETETPDLTIMPKLERPSIMKERVAAKEAAAAAAPKLSDAGKADSSKKVAKGSGVDYLADYEDENELHIPNRIGFSTLSWGDESKGFVPKSNKKLKKKQIAQGKFVPGDLQVSSQTN